MRTTAKYIAILVIGILISILYSNNYIHVSLMNSTSIDKLEVVYSIDEAPNELIYLEPSTMSSKFNIHQTTFGKHKLKIKCEALKIDTTIRVFTFKNNYVDFEFQNEYDKEPIILTRYSWFPLIYM